MLSFFMVSMLSLLKFMDVIILSVEDVIIFHGVLGIITRENGNIKMITSNDNINDNTLKKIT